ncbi:beta strand repeat-containing protein [Paracoccus sphaerophysae]|uniref:beta strand repeat-containing protein n=1 Tax=Paracoccus sphaerophysae TaxID=690417 RepID=UPI002359C182|nr:hypothetical protein [Paracoccus sphaerophysae]
MTARPDRAARPTALRWLFLTTALTTLAPAVLAGRPAQAEIITGEVTLTADRSIAAETVDVRGTLIGDAHDVIVQPDGALIVGNATDAGTVSGMGQLDNAGAVSVAAGSSAEAGTTTNRAGGTLDVAGSLTTALDNQGGATTTLAGGRMIGNTRNAGTITGNGAIEGSLDNSGAIAVAAGDRLHVTGTAADDFVTTSTGTITLAGTLQARLANEAGGSVTLQGGTLSGSLANRGTLSGSGTIDGTLANQAAGTVVGAGETLVVTGGTTNGGGLQVAGTMDSAVANQAGATVSLTGGSIDGSLANNGMLRGYGVIDGDLTNTASDSDIAAVFGSGLTLQVTGQIRNSGTVGFSGRLEGDMTNEAAGDFALRGEVVGRLVNDGTLRGAGRVTGALDNQGTTSIGEGRTLAVTLGTTNAAGGTIALTGGTLAGDVTNRGRISGTGAVSGTVENGGRIETAGNLAIDSLVNRAAGSVTVGSGHALRSDRIDNRGAIAVAGTLDAASVENAAGATLGLAGGRLTGTLVNRGAVDGSGTIQGDLQNLGRAVLAGAVNGRITNERGAGLIVTGVLATSGLQTRADSRTTIETRGALTSTDTIGNGGLLHVFGRVNGGVSNRAEATLFMRDGTITRAVSNDGTLVGRGRIEGALVNTNRADLAGTLATVDNRGVFGTAGNLSAVSVLNRAGGTLNVDAGHVLTTTGAAGTVNAGTANIAGRLTGGLTNTAGATTSLRAGSQVEGTLVNQLGGTVTGSAQLSGRLVNSGSATLAGRVALVSNAGDLETGGDLTVDRLTSRGGSVTIGAGHQLTSTQEPVRLLGGSLAVAGTLHGAATTARGTTTTLAGGLITGAVTNGGTLSGSGRITGRLGNQGEIAVAAGQRLAATGGVANGGELSIVTGGVLASNVDNDGEITVSGMLDGALDNRGTAVLSGGQVTGMVTNSGALAGEGRVGALRNLAGATLSVAAGETLIADNRVVNEGRFDLGGILAGSLDNRFGATTNLSPVGAHGPLATVNGSVTNAGTIGGDGRITGNLYAQGGAYTGTNLVVDGRIVTGPVARPQMAAPRAVLPPSFVVGTGSTVTTGGGLSVTAGTGAVVAGTLNGDVGNAGSYLQTGLLRGTLESWGTAELGGEPTGAPRPRVTGDILQRAGTLVARGDLSVGGTLAIEGGTTTVSGRFVAVEGGTRIGVRGQLDLPGRLYGDVVNHGTLRGSGAESEIVGDVTNDGTLTLENGAVGDVLTVTSLGGTGQLVYDINSADMTADTIRVSGGATTGQFHFSFNSLSDRTVNRVGQSVTLLDVDGTQGARNSFGFTHEGVPSASEKIVYSILRDGATGDVVMQSQVNPAIGATFANVTLVQSLIGSLVNRPTSPYVSGLATDSAGQPCGAGGWSRATGGHARVDGTTDNGVQVEQNTVSLDYYGLQGGADFACFDNSPGGWNLAVGAIAGVNVGDTVQPIFTTQAGIDARRVLASITTTHFQQSYAGVYATATRDRLQGDLQLRVERTAFQVKNKPVEGVGLGITDPDFTSTGFTLSGSTSYTIPLGKTGWNLTPTAGFAWSKFSTDDVVFDEGYRLEFEDGERRIGFLGATLSRTFVQQASNSALQSFATATYYKDFADPAVSWLVNSANPDFESQRLLSDNLESYGEVSIGANYVKVLDPGGPGRPRQFSTSARIDARFGDSVDSVGVTGQLRWQF